MIRDEIRRGGWLPLLAELAVFLLLMGAVLALTVVAWGMGQ